MLLAKSFSLLRCFFHLTAALTFIPSSAFAIIKNDFDGDGKSDLAVWRPSDGSWYVIPSSGTCPSQMIPFFGYGCVRQWGLNGDTPVMGNYDGLDSRLDYSVARPPAWTWYLHWSAYDGNFVLQFGLTGDRVSRGDFEGDARTDITVFRPSEARWYIRWSSDGLTRIYDQPLVETNVISVTPTPGYFEDPSRVNRSVYIKSLISGTQVIR